MKRVIIWFMAAVLWFAVNAAFGSEITGVERDEISIKAGPTQPGEKLSMVWLESLVYPKVVKKDKIISLGVRLTTRVDKVKASFDFGKDEVSLSSDDGLYWSGAYQLPAGIDPGLHVARYVMSNRKGSIQRTVEFFIEKASAAEQDQVQVYNAEGWPLKVKSTCSALVGGSSRVLYAGQKVIGLSKAPWYKVIFEDGEIGWVSATEVEEPIQEYFQLGLNAYSKKRYASAIAYFKDTVAIDPQFLKGHYWLAKCYIQQGKLDAAYSSIKDAMRLNERDMNSKVLADQLAKRYYAVASSKLRSGRYHEAIAAYQKVLDLKPSSVASWIEMGKGYQKLGLGNEARAAWQEALRYDAENQTVLAMLGIKTGTAVAQAQVKPMVAKKVAAPAKPAQAAAPKAEPKTVAASLPKPSQVPALVADDSLAIVKAEKTRKGTSVESALKSVISLTKSLGTPIAEKGWEVKNRGEKFLVRYLCEQGAGALEAFEWVVDVDSHRVSAYNDNARLLMTRW